jgi:hypothetical protein
VINFIGAVEAIFRRASNRMEELPCFCINLDDRKDKLEETHAVFKDTGIVMKRFPAIRHSESWRGCGASHVAVAREALRQGLKWVLVIEDDCMPSADFAERWPTVKKALWENRGAWDIFLGGPTYVQGPVKPLGSDLIQIEIGYALHFYVLNASAYERAIAWNPDRHGPIDVYYSDQFRIVTTHPILATQRPSVSDIKMVDTDYSYMFDDTDRSLRQLQYTYYTRNGTLALLFLSIIALSVIWLKK